ncbi:MAG: TNT domain-containing protein [Rubrivivax sp.]|nr:TNT domain-containing protein [Rubrivivax sp.]
MSSVFSFIGGVGQGVASAAENTWEGAKSLAKTGHALATNPQAREEAWNGAKRVAGDVGAYGSAAMQDPAMVWRDAKGAAGSAWTAFDEFRATAGPEDWGQVVGGGAFEVGTALIPIGAATKLTKVGAIADKASDISRVTRKLPDKPPVSVQPCPVVVSATKKKMRLRDDLGPEHFDADGKLKWPPKNGFAGTPEPATLAPGTVIDRYSARAGTSDKGNFFSPEGTPYTDRALPYDPSKMTHARYEVLKPLEVQSGSAAAAFGHKGGGTQYLTPLGTDELIQQGYLRRL